MESSDYGSEFLTKEENTNMGKEEIKAYQINSFKGGISDFNDRGLRGSGKFMSAADIYRKDDNLACGQALKAEVFNFEDLILWFIVAPDNCIYGFGDKGRIYKRDQNGNWSKVYTDPKGKITGASLWWQIIEQDPVTQIATHEPHLFWATDTDLNHKKIPGEDDWSDVNETITATIPDVSTDPETGDIIYDTKTVTQDYPKTNLELATWHTMREAGGALMICNDYKLALVGYDTSYTPEAVQFSPGQQAVTITERGDDMVIGTSSSLSNTTSALYTWRYEYKNWGSEHRIKVKNIESMIDTEMMLMVASGKLWFSDMYQELPICDFPGGGHCKPSGTEVMNGVALFALDNCVRRSGDKNIAANGIYGYGRSKNADNPVLNLEYPILCEELGGLLVNGETLFCACRVQQEGQNVYKVMTLDNEHKQICEYESLELPLPYTGTPSTCVVNRIIVRTRPISEGTKIECYYRSDISGAWIKARFQGQMTGQNDSDQNFIAGNEGIFLVGAPAHTIEFKLILYPSGNLTPEVEEIYLEFYGRS
jgi:hypothetical protein